MTETPEYDLPADVLQFLFDMVTDFHGQFCMAEDCATDARRRWVKRASDLIGAHYVSGGVEHDDD